MLRDFEVLGSELSEVLYTLISNQLKSVTSEYKFQLWARSHLPNKSVATLYAAADEHDFTIMGTFAHVTELNCWIATSMGGWLYCSLTKAPVVNWAKNETGNRNNRHATGK
ncbi:hypothetical protein LSH36_589g03045 [Paralvinella palmiformis]|uniref:Uncharacterized protein n=1 Tax=Paralvinella palmiformis TaxID=53620 RepID=A0AAD9J5C2_9ANNE|nr:hypothetical protein LSH36_589g03045 [Paralvinella palmiformis]